MGKQRASVKRLKKRRKRLDAIKMKKGVSLTEEERALYEQHFEYKKNWARYGRLKRG